MRFPCAARASASASAIYYPSRSGHTSPPHLATRHQDWPRPLRGRPFPPSCPHAAPRCRMLKGTCQAHAMGLGPRHFLSKPKPFAKRLCTHCARAGAYHCCTRTSDRPSRLATRLGNRELRVSLGCLRRALPGRHITHHTSPYTLGSPAFRRRAVHKHT
jgi:hypothetical protein